MPEAYYEDWLCVADDEVRHFIMVRDYLRRYGCDYGDMDAHHGLWEMAERTADDVLERMALVPRTLEARGLDGESTFGALVHRHFPYGLQGPFNEAARAHAGFSSREMSMLEVLG